MSAVDTVTQYAVQYGMQAVVALGIFGAGVMAARWAGGIAQESLERLTHSSAPGEVNKTILERFQAAQIEFPPSIVPTAI